MFAAFVEKPGDQRFPEYIQYPGAQDGKQQTHPQLEAEYPAHPFRVPFAKVLGTENARTGMATEDAQVEHKDKLVANGNAAHLFRADGAHHKVVQQVYELSDAVLHHNGQRYRQNHFVEGFISYIFFKKSLFFHRAVLYRIKRRFARKMYRNRQRAGSTD